MKTKPSTVSRAAADAAGGSDVERHALLDEERLLFECLTWARVAWQREGQLLKVREENAQRSLASRLGVTDAQLAVDWASGSVEVRPIERANAPKETG